MSFLINAITFVAQALILIGDFVIFLFSLVIKLKTNVLRVTKSVVKKINLKKLRLETDFGKQGEKILVSFVKARESFGKPKRRKSKPKTIIAFKTSFFFKFKFFFLGVLFALIFIFIPYYVFVFFQSLPNPVQISQREIPQTTKIYDRNKNLLYQIYVNQNRTVVPLAEIPKDLVNATIAIEDKDFYKNPGFDVQAIIRAAIADLSGRPIQGGSTITQQLVKSTLLTPEVSITRKIKEIILAFWTEQIYNKDQILEMYFNQVSYGGTAWGVEAAAEVYFGKEVKDLDLAQSAFLAGMTQSPTTYSPYGEHPDLWKERQKEVLQKMYQFNDITKLQEEQAALENLTFQPPQTPIQAPHFVMYVKDLLIQKYGLPLVEKGGLSIITTLDLKTQQMAQDVVTKEVQNDAYLNLTNGAALVTNPKNGDILAMVGSKDYDDPNGGNVNLTTALRQPGSSIKVVTYSSALANGFTAATILDDTPITYTSPGAPPYSPVNYDGAFHGRIPLRLALANSFNVPAVKTLQKIGIPQMVAEAKEMGITTWDEPGKYGLAITLGAAEVRMTDMAVVYGTLANEGEKVNLDPILKITDPNGNILYQKQEDQGQKVLDPGIAYIMSNILADNNARSWEFGANSPLQISGHTVSVKTGTSDNKRDNWTFGFTPSILVSVWVGNNDNTPMNPVLASGITGAAPIWHNIMQNLLDGSKDEQMTMPSDIIQKSCHGKDELFVKGTENLVDCNAKLSPNPSPVAH